ncbi:MAG: Sec-dependent nitrous-oxide reductase [Gemmatimonadaceae bacterium]|nr:Sec-dependent nitrous-oxide reductase [Gemmatimonadaceae bacterium]
MSLSRRTAVLSTAVAVAVGAGLFHACAPTSQSGGIGAAADAAARTYVAPGSYDEYYAFMSGGFSGQVAIYGLPSGRLLKVIPVFSQNPENGYGYNAETKDLLQTTWGHIPWDDSHHPALSVTNSEHDGRWLFINANNTPRIARIDLTTMTTTETIQIPNSGGNHSSPYVTANTEYAVAGTRFSVPIPQEDVPISDFASKFKGAISFIRADKPGDMKVAWQFIVPGFDYDLARAGKGPSADWIFFTTYNTEQAYTKKEVEASRNDKDFVMALNWKKLEACVAEGRASDWPSEYFHNVMDERTHTARSERVRGVKVLTPGDCPDAAYYLPTPKSPHGVDVDPTGEFIVAGGKLATVIPVHAFSRMQQAITDKAFDGDRNGIPVFKYEAVNFCEVQNPGLGPLHTEFDGNGNAYTSVFITSEIVKYTLPGCQVVDRIPTYYSIGHLLVPGGDTRKPYGKYVIALNKITKDRYLPTGPELTQSAQLIDITGEKMKLLLDFPTIGEPHYAQAIDAQLIRDKQVKFFRLADNAHPYVAKTEAEVNVTRTGKTVHVKMTAIRSHFAPDNIEGVQVGDTVLFHVTNLEQDWDVPHGFAAIGSAHDAELLIMPGETRTLKWVAKFPGVYPFYCTDFCSALHQEMQGYVRVSPAGSGTPLKWSVGK